MTRHRQRILRVRQAAFLALTLFGSSAVLARQAPTLGDRPAAPEAPHIVLAVVDGRELTLKTALDTFLSAHSGHGVLVRGEAAVRDLAGRLVERELFLIEAETLGVPDEPAVVEVLDDYRRQTAANEYWKRSVQDRVKITDEEVEGFYAKTDQALGLTLIECADRATVEALRARVLAGEEMGVLARTASIHSSRTFDGALQYVRRGELERGLEDAAFGLAEVGDLSEIVRTENGHAFVRLDERSVNPERPPRETALPQIRGILEERALKRLAAELEERTQAAAEAWVDEERLGLASLLDGSDPGIVVARAAGDSLTLQDVRDGLDLDALRRADPGEVADVGLKLARQWVRAESIIHAARTAGLFEDPAVTSKVADFERDVVMKFLCDRYVWPDTAPSEAELRAFYDAHVQSDYTTAPEVHLAYIVVDGDAEASAVLARIADGEDFGKLAREVSKDSASSVHGGRIGWVQPGKLLPEVEERVFALPAGAVDGPITTPIGSFVVRVIERKDARVVPFEVARSAVQKAVVKERQAQAYAKWAEALRERADVVLDENGVRAAVEWLEGQARAREAEKASRPPAERDPAAPPGHGAVLPGARPKPAGEERP